MFCQNCGTENPEGSAFCKGCGSALKIAPVPAAEPVVEPVAATPVTEIPNDTQTNYTPVPTKDPGKGFGIAAMIMGILSLVTTGCCCMCVAYFSPLIGLPFAILGLIFGIVARKKSKSAGLKNPMATAGIITSVVCLVICVILGILFLLYMLFGIGVAIFESAQTVPNDMIRPNYGESYGGSYSGSFDDSFGDKFTYYVYPSN